MLLQGTTVLGPGFSALLSDPVLYQEGGYSVKVIVSAEEMEEAYRLRHTIFCRELGWVLDARDGLEVDEYDDNAVAFGVYDTEGRLSAYLRLIMPDKPFMLERVFSSLVWPEHRIRKDADTAEISRLCVAPHARNDKVRGNFGAHGVSMLLFKGAHHWSVANGVRFLYAVAEEKVYRLFIAKGFPYRLVGDPTDMPDGARVGAVLLDWREFETLNAAGRPRLLEWFYSRSTSPASPAIAAA